MKIFRHLLQNRTAFIVGFFTLSALTLLIYWSGLFGPMLFDDIPVIAENPALHIQQLSPESLYNAAYSTSTGPLARPVAVLSFALNWFFFQENTFYYKLTNVLLHLITTFILFFVLVKILHRINSLNGGLKGLPERRLAFIICALWALHPLHVSTVLYTVQRMSILATIFSLLTLFMYLHWRVNSATKNVRFHIGYGMLCITSFTLAILSKENALVTIGLIYLVESTLFEWQAESRSVRGALTLTRAACILALVVFCLYLAKMWPNFEATYLMRDFTWQERLLTQSRVLWMYISQIILPNSLVFSLHHDDFSTSTSLFTPFTTFIALSLWVVVLLALLKYWKRYAIISFGLIWFLTAHSVEANVIPLEMVFEHRNYLPSIGLVFSLVMVMVSLSSRLNYRFVIAMLICYCFILTISTWARASDWKSLQQLVFTDIQRHPNSYRSHYDAGLIHFEHYINETDPTKKIEFFNAANYHFQRSTALNQRFLGALIAQIRLMEVALPNEQQAPLDELHSRLRQKTMAFEDAHHIVDWLRCNLRQQCASRLDVIQPTLTLVLKKQDLPLSERGVILRDYAIFLANRESYAEASHLIEEATAIHGKDPHLWAIAGKIHVSAKNEELARQAVQRLKKLAPESIDIQEIEARLRTE